MIKSLKRIIGFGLLGNDDIITIRFTVKKKKFVIYVAIPLFGIPNITRVYTPPFN